MLDKLDIKRNGITISQHNTITCLGCNSASYVGPKIWNNLTNECKLEENLNKFKHKIKDTFFANIRRINDDIYPYY